MFAVTACSTMRFWRRSGAGNSIFRSKRPGRKSAGSNVSARFVAMMTLTFVDWSKPSIWFSSSSRMRWTSRSAPVCASKRFVAMASISSMKMMAGAFSRARRKTSRTMRGPSPRYFCTNSEPTTEMNEAVVELATALAIIVLPVPGGPYRSTPFGGSMPSVRNRSGCRSGSSTTSRSFSSDSLAPPTSSYVTSGLSSTVMRLTVGSIFGGSGIWIAYFVRSTPTRMPSSMSVGATFSPKPTTNLAICLTLIMYLQSSVPSSMILVHRATCSGCSSCMACLSETRSHCDGMQRPVSESLMPMSSLTFFSCALMSSSHFFRESVYGPLP
mmetsp:Transcript_23451/g.70411  ORF Transcript_23451/g.70411 Transcript_23451/m.70411 type:complete len:327 (-) Transcript_23451:179-1159(-)